MDAFDVSADRLGTASKQCARRLLSMGENRLELLTLEVEEGLAQLVQMVLLVLVLGVLGLLGAITLTAAVVVQFWALSPVGVLLTVSGCYGILGFVVQQRLSRLMREWRVLGASLDQFKKDRACLMEGILQ